MSQNKHTIIGKNIKALRKAHGWTQEQLAKVVGSTASILSKGELGTRPLDVVTLIAIANAFGVGYADLFKDGNKTLTRNIDVPVRVWDKIDTMISEKGWSEEGFAESCGLTPMAFYNYRTGRNNPTVGNFDRIISNLGMTAKDFKDGELFAVEEITDGYEQIKNAQVRIIDTLISALEDIRGELCGSKSMP